MFFVYLWVLFSSDIRVCLTAGSEESVDSLARIASLQNAAVGLKPAAVKGKDNKPPPVGKDSKTQPG